MKCQLVKVKGNKRNTEWVIKNNGELVYTYTEALQKGISRTKFKKALKELVEKGFIDIAHKGNGGVKGDYSLYGVSERWKDFGTDKFIFKTMKKDNRQGRGFAKYWKDKRSNIGIEIDTDMSINFDTPLGKKEPNGVSEIILH